MSKTTHVVAVLDRSTSMMGSEKQVINSFNEFIKGQRQIEGKVKVTLVLFDNTYQVVWDKVPLELIPKLTREAYVVQGSTALNDAIGKTIRSFESKKKVIFLVQTDGEENSSTEFSVQQVKSLIKEKSKWEFVFIGSDLSKQQTNSMSFGYGFSPDKTFSYAKSKVGFSDMTETLSTLTTSYRIGGGSSNTTQE